MPRPLGHVLSELFFNVTEAHQIKEAKYSSLGYARQYGGGGGGGGLAETRATRRTPKLLIQELFIF